MPMIKPVSELRNYPEILKEVKVGSPVYLTKNGRGCYAVVDMDYVETYDRMKAELQLFGKLLASEKRAEREGWLSLDDVKKELGI